MNKVVETGDKSSQRESDYRLVNWTFLMTVLFYLGGSFLFSGFVSQMGNLPLRLLFSQLLLALPPIGYLYLRREPVEKLICFRPLGLGRVLLVLLFGILSMPFMTFINALSLLVTTNHVTGELSALMAYPFLVSLLFVAFIPAILEEIVYRGVFFQEYRSISLPKGILLSGLLFGLMHLNLNQFCYAFVMGCIFALVVEATGTILSSMLIHFMINTISTVMTYWMPQEGTLLGAGAGASDKLTLREVFSLGGMAVIPTILAVLVLMLLARLEKRTHIWQELLPWKNREIKSDRRVMTLPLLAGSLICIGYIILYELVFHG